MADSRTYIRVHDGLPDHPKVFALSDKAFRLLVETWCWCSHHLTDGAISTAVWNKRSTAKARKELIDAGLVEVTDAGVVMHDYLEHQRSAADVEEIRRKKREAGRKGGMTRAANQANGKQVLEQMPSGSEAEGQAKSNTETETETETDLSRGSVDHHLRPQTRERADDDDDLDKINDQIEGRIIELLVEATGRTVDRPWASRVRRQLLDGRDVKNPLGYVASAIRGDPARYLPPPAEDRVGLAVIAEVNHRDPDAAARAAQTGAEQARALLTRKTSP